MDELEKKAYIFGQIFASSNKLQVLGDKFDKNVTVKQWLFIVGVSKFKEPPTVSEVANYVGYSRQNAKRLAAALKARGYVTIAKDKQDARALRIALTPKSVEYFSRRNQRELEFLNQIFDGFNTELTDGFYKGLAKLADNIEKMMSNEDRMRNE
jgi:DNA-binding MarR family transcriptional regulator